MGSNSIAGADISSRRLRTTTLRVNKIPLSASASDLYTFFQETIGSVYACKIASHYPNSKSRGSGFVQFDTISAADKALGFDALPLFQSVGLEISTSEKDVIVRAVDPKNRVSGCVLHVGWMVEERWLEVLGSWNGVRVDFLPERNRLDVVLEDCRGDCYKMEIGFDDVDASFGCSLVGVEENALLLKLRYGPKMYRRLSKKSGNKHCFIGNEEDIYIWVRSTDFSASYSIGHSTHFCLELPEGVSTPSCLPFYEELGDLDITERDAKPLSRLVPLVNSTLPYEIVFQLNSLVHKQKISYGQINNNLFSVLSGLSLETAQRVLLELHKVRSTCYDPLKFINNEVERMMGNHKTKTHLSSKAESVQSKNLMSCHRVLITPLRIYLLGPEMEKSNYIVNHYAEHASDFLRVSFVDEDWSKLPSQAISTKTEHGIFSKPYRTEIHRRILDVLCNGITIGAKKFEFLAFSASQLRSGSVWMFASSETLTAESIREWMGHFKQIRSVSKCAARMGQLFSSSQQTFNVLPQDVQIIPDIEVTDDGIRYCFSDGIGKISEPFATELAKYCKFSETPSAFQIRYGGYKGVVAVDRSSSYKLSLRPSMLKFDSNNIMFNVTTHSKSTPCFLNRDIICLLSTLGIEDKVFEDLQREQMQLMEGIFTCKLSALKFLTSMASDGTKTAVKMLIHGYKPISEPYLMMVLKSYCEYHLASLKNKWKIFVPKGRVLLGCLDETGSLNYGQVFIQVTMTKDELELQQDQDYFQKFNEKTAIVTGKIVVTKNPCLHPGDIRILEAVRNDHLMNLVDCIVFPQKGERPHPNECSGGDLDGDQYFICWDKKLVPLESETPMDYVGRRPRVTDHEVSLQEIYNFFVDYMINDTIGVISNAHLVHADREPTKARSAKCLELAKLHSMAVDFAKTGAPAEMPTMLRPKKYPDFMERHDKPMYISTGILGKLYRKTIEHFAGNNFILSKYPEESPGGCCYYDDDLEVKGFELYIDVALDYKNQYSEKFKSLMNYYGAECEAEILTGNLLNRPKYLENDRRRYGEVMDQIEIGLKALQTEVHDKVRSFCDEKSYPMLASACYHVSYHPKYLCSKNNDFLSFPWLFCDVLLSVKSSKALNRWK